MSIKVNINLKLNFELQIDFQHTVDIRWYVILYLYSDYAANGGWEC